MIQRVKICVEHKRENYHETTDNVKEVRTHHFPHYDYTAIPTLGYRETQQ